MDLALNNLQWLICHKTKQNKTKFDILKSTVYILCGKTCFFAHITHSSVNFSCFSLLSHQNFNDKLLFNPEVKVKLTTVVEGDSKALFSIATTLKCGEGATPFAGLLHFTLDTYLIILRVK